MLSELQESILNKKNKRIVVLSAAASGKSRLAVEKVRQVIKKGINPKKIVVITFTNMAAEELRERLGEDYKDGLFIGTVHSLANYYLNAAGIDTSKLLEEENFDRLFYKVKDNPGCVKEVDFLLLDEAQDSTKAQFEFILSMIRPKSFFFLGDTRQSIYGWSGAKPEILEELMNRPGVAVYSLNENYRNGNNILNFAKRIISRTGNFDDSVGMTQKNGRVEEFWDNQLGLVTKEILLSGDYKNWAIICRTNDQLEQFKGFLLNYNIPFDSFKQSEIKLCDLKEKLKANTVKLLTIHASKGLEWDNVVVLGVRYGTKEEIRIGYVAATRARKRLLWVKTKPKTKYQPKNRVESWC